MSFMSEMNFWPLFPLNQTPETMKVFFSFYKTRVLLEFTHNSTLFKFENIAKDTLGLAPPTHRSHLNLPPAGAEKI